MHGIASAAAERGASAAPPTGDPRRAGASLREIAAFAVVALAVRLALVAVDAAPRFFLGDSESYLFTSLRGWIPNDRSWIYGLAINGLLDASQTLTSVILVQTLASAALCAALAAACRSLGVRRTLAWAALGVLSADPLLLMYDRSIMTDQPATVALALGVLLAATGMLRRSPAPWWGAAACLLAGVALRPALAPVTVWVVLFGAGHGAARAFRARRDGSRWAGRAALAELAAGPGAAAALVAIGLVAYAVVTGNLTRSRPSLNPRSGYFLLGVVSPILKPQDLAMRRIPDPVRILEGTWHEDRSQRDCQIFCPDRIAFRLEAALGDWREVSRAGGRIARRAVLRDPLGFAALCGAHAWDFLTYPPDVTWLDASLGVPVRLPDHLVARLQSKVRDPITAEMPATPSPLLDWARSLRRWPSAVCWVGLVAPLAALATRRRLRVPAGVMILLGTTIWVYAATAFALSTVAVPRYLLPLAPLVLAFLAAWIEGLLAPAPARAARPADAAQQSP